MTPGKSQEGITIGEKEKRTKALLKEGDLTMFDASVYLNHIRGLSTKQFCLGDENLRKTITSVDKQVCAYENGRQ